MPADFLHNHPQFSDLVRIVAAEKRIDPALVEKDYWIMHSLFGLQQSGMKFELKGGTSLSKGFQIINRFSEDIDIRIEPPSDQDVKTGRNHDKPLHIESRRKFYEWLANTIRINGINKVARATEYDNKQLTSAGIRLSYKTFVKAMAGLKEGVVLEVGFDDVSPNTAKDISSWLYDYAAKKIEIIDNRAKGVACYDPGYTFVEKLQTVSTKFRQQQVSGDSPLAFMRHYYDIYSLLQRPEVQKFIGTPAYTAHKERRFRGGDNLNISENDAFIVSDPATRNSYTKAFAESTVLYYGDKPTFEKIIAEIAKWTGKL
jgi:predicted nucleotidyltransferase component of viral defense system